MKQAQPLRPTLTCPLPLSIAIASALWTMPAMAQICIDPPNHAGLSQTRSWAWGSSTLGASLSLGDGMSSAEDLRRLQNSLPSWFPRIAVPPDYVSINSNAGADLQFFGSKASLLWISAFAKRESGAFATRRTIEVGGRIISSGALSGFPQTYGPYTQRFFTVSANYSGVSVSGHVSGDIQLKSAQAQASSSQLKVAGAPSAALVLEGSAGVSLLVAGAGLRGAADLFRVGTSFDHGLGLSSGGRYDFHTNYDLSTLSGRLALYASALGVSTNLWSTSWTGVTLSTRTLYDAHGCVR